jgi:hypothetical protein
MHCFNIQEQKAIICFNFFQIQMEVEAIDTPPLINFNIVGNWTG